MKVQVAVAALTLVVSASALAAGVPGEIAYQGFLTQANLPVEGPHDLEFTVYADSTGGSPLPWQEGHQAVQFIAGVFKVQLGKHQPFPAGLFAAPNRFLETKVDGQTLAPRTRLAAVPYALTAARADTAAFAESGGIGESLWQQNGQDIYYTGGNVGIGTANTTQRLRVAGGGILLDNNWAISWRDPGNSTDIGAVMYDNQNRLLLRPGATERMTIDGNSGYVGIGTTQPPALLTVRRDDPNYGGGPVLFLQNLSDPNNVGASAELRFGRDEAGGLAKIKAHAADWYGQNYELSFWTGNNGASNEAFRITKDGRIGIGTTNPTAKLDVAGDICVTGAKNAIVPTSQGMRKLYCDESTSPLFSTRGWGQLTDGQAHIDLDPLYLETVTIDSEHPMMVDATFYGPHGNWYVEAGRTGFDLVDPSGSTVRFHWVVQAARRGYEAVYLEPADVARVEEGRDE